MGISLSLPLFRLPSTLISLVCCLNELSDGNPELFSSGEGLSGWQLDREKEEKASSQDSNLYDKSPWATSDDISAVFLEKGRHKTNEELFCSPIQWGEGEEKCTRQMQ